MQKLTKRKPGRPRSPVAAAMLANPAFRPKVIALKKGKGAYRRLAVKINSDCMSIRLPRLIDMQSMPA